MANGQVVTLSGKKIALNRLWKAAPDYDTPTVFKVGTGTTTPVVADTNLVSALTIGAATTKAFVGGYPILDEANLTVTTRCLVLTTEANGGGSTSITEFGIFNEDASPLCYSRAVFTAITKTDNVQITFVQKDVIL